MKFGEENYPCWFMSKSWHVSVSRYKQTFKLSHIRPNVIVNALTLSFVLKSLTKIWLVFLTSVNCFCTSVAVSINACLVRDMMINIFNWGFQVAIAYRFLFLHIKYSKSFRPWRCTKLLINQFFWIMLYSGCKKGLLLIEN